MPKVQTAPATPKAAPKAKAPPAPERPKVYPELAVNGVPLPREKVRLSYDQVVALIGWESEADYIARRVAENPSLGLKTDAIKFGSEYLLVDNNDQKVRCAHNSRNRPFDEPTARGYEQDHLTRKWRFNGEAFIVDEFGDVISGQHRGVGFILAVQAWRKDLKWRKYWPEEPYFETVVVVGVPGDQATRATLDNVRPRKLSDTIYTSELFAKLDDYERRVASGMLDAAVDLFWKRTGAGTVGDEKVYQTHAMSHDLLTRHPKLTNAVKHLQTVNKDRDISKLKVAAGDCAALMYLMAACGTGHEAYLKAGRTQTACDMRYWDKAEEFWTLVGGDDKSVAPLRAALALIEKGDLGTLELKDKKLAVIVLTWNAWSADQKFGPKDVLPKCIKNSAGELVMDPTNLPLLGGIDVDSEPEVEKTPEELAAEKEDARKAKEAKKGGGKATAQQPQVNPVAEAIAGHRAAAPGKVLIYEIKDNGYGAWDADADLIAPIVKMPPKNRPDGLRQLRIPAGYDVNGLAEELRLKGHKVAMVMDDGQTIRDMLPNPKPATAKPAPAATAPKPAATPAPEATPPAKRGGLKLRPGNASA